MSDKVFVDTNVLVYAYDRSHREKHGIASELVSELWRSGSGVISTQVMQEFYVVITNKVPRPLPRARARATLSDLMKWEVVVNGNEDVLAAVDLQEKYGFSFWDSLILRSCMAAGADTLVSEDMVRGRAIAGLDIVNPFE